MASATFGHICRHFSTKDFTTYSFTDCLGAHMTIPGLLAEIMGNGFQFVLSLNRTEVAQR